MKTLIKHALTAAIITIHTIAPAAIFGSEGSIMIQLSPVPAIPGTEVTITATGVHLKKPMLSGEVDIRNAADKNIINNSLMTQLNDTTFRFTYTIPPYEQPGTWQVKCKLSSHDNNESKRVQMAVVPNESINTHSPAACSDNDGDGFANIVCGGSDCNDYDSSISPGNVDMCGDGIDQDCSGADHACLIVSRSAETHQATKVRSGLATGIACFEGQLPQCLNVSI